MSDATVSCAVGSTLTCLVNGENKENQPEKWVCKPRRRQHVWGFSRITPMHSAPHFGFLKNLFDFSIIHLWILRKIFFKTPKPSKSVKILKKTATKSREGGARIEMAILSSQHRICFGEDDMVTWQFQVNSSILLL